MSYCESADLSIVLDHSLVSVIIPCFNSEKYIHECLASCLAQTYKHIEILAVNDGSTDSTRPSLHQFKTDHPYLRMLILEHQDCANKGVAASRSLALKHANGGYICFLDSDDIFEPSKIEKQVSCLNRYPSVVLCHTAIRIIGSEDLAHEHEHHFSSSPTTPYAFDRLSDFLFRLHICNSSVMIRSSCIRRIAYPSEMLNANEDWLLWVLLSQSGYFIQLSDKLVCYRRHKASLTSAENLPPLLSRHARIEFLILVTMYAFPSRLSAKSCFLLLRSFMGLCRLYWGGRSLLAQPSD